MPTGVRGAWRSVVFVGDEACAEKEDRLDGKVHAAGDISSALELVDRETPDAVFVHEGCWEPHGQGLLSHFQSSRKTIPLVVLSDEPNMNNAIRFVRDGAHDYISGPLTGERISGVLESFHRENPKCRRGDLFSEHCPPNVAIVGRSEAMSDTLETIRLISESRCNPVLITGETGCGKELAAQAVHSWRHGNHKPFVAVNCAALTATLLESELFGHVKGAFTGADRDKTGLFELAGDGTLFLDEISEMPPELQAKLLRVLQGRTFRKVGGQRDAPCFATIIASSNRDLHKSVEEGTFRKDLYYRLAVFPIYLTPLRDPRRREDIPLLAEFFLEQSEIRAANTGEKKLSEAAVQKLMEHDWPGNVRELRNVIDRAIIVARGGCIDVEHLKTDNRQDQENNNSQVLGKKPKDFSLETAEREFIIRALQETGGQRTRAAALLGITRATLHAKLKRYDITPPSDSNESSRFSFAESA